MLLNDWWSDVTKFLQQKEKRIIRFRRIENRWTFHTKRTFGSRPQRNYDLTFSSRFYKTLQIPWFGEPRKWKINELPRVANRAVAFNTSSGPSVPFPPMGTAWQQTVTADLTSAVAKGSRLHPTLSGFDSGCLEKHMWEESEEASAVYNSLMWCHNLPPLLMAVCWRIVYLLIPMLGPIYARLLLTFWGPKKGPFCRVVLLQFP